MAGEYDSEMSDRFGAFVTDSEHSLQIRSIRYRFGAFVTDSEHSLQIRSIRCRFGAKGVGGVMLPINCPQAPRGMRIVNLTINSAGSLRAEIIGTRHGNTIVYALSLNGKA